MAQHNSHIIHNYGVSNMSDFHPEHYLQDGTSTTSSPSPTMWHVSEQYIHPSDDYQFEAFQDPSTYNYYEPVQAAPIVEFTDLTAPYHEDRRRRRTQAKDKQAISSMHMRRRAQNRASQRAFRERKEKHAQDLQHQLDQLESKHKVLKASYDELGSTNKKLLCELDSLKDRIVEIQASQDTINQHLDAGTPESLGEDSN